MAMLYYLKMMAEKQGEMKCEENTQKGREGWIRCSAFESACMTPRDAQSGQATGKRRYTPIKVVKDVDSATPLIWNALVTNENIKSAEFKFYRSGQKAAAGIEENFFTIKLTNARIVGVRSYLLDMYDPEHAKVPMEEEVELTFQKIEWTHNPAKKMASDDWEAPV